MNNSQTILLAEMGLGPVWKLRQNLPSTKVVAQAPLSLQAEAKVPAPETHAAQDAAPGGCPVCGFFAVSRLGAPHTLPDYLFVAQSVGADQADQGAVLEGASGALLDNMLRALGVQRGGKAVLVNLIHFRSAITQTHEKLGSADVLSLCQTCLKQLVESMQPSILIALGHTAAVSLLGRDASQAFASLQGQLHEYQGRPLLVTYDPVYLLKRPKDKGRAWSDLCLALQTLTGA